MPSQLVNIFKAGISISKYGRWRLAIFAMLLLALSPACGFCLDVEAARAKAEKGDVSAQAQLGEYYYGLGRWRSAATWLEKAAEKGDPASLNFLGLMYFHGDLKTNASHSKALELFAESAKRGNADALYNMGRVYELSSNKKIRSFSKAIECYREGMAKGSAKSFYGMGRMHDRGKGLEVNVTKAMELYRQAADRGCSEAAYEFGFNLYNGIGAARDRETATEYLGKACDGGFSKACEKYSEIKKTKPQDLFFK